MYKKGTYRIVENRPLTSNVYRMQVEGDTQWIVRPGQFVNIEIEGFYLRRPISICDYSDNTITLIYKVVGRGTEAMSHMQAGCELDMLTGLGNGFDPDVECCRPLLVGGGVGTAPLLQYGRELNAAGRKVWFLLGGRTASDVLQLNLFEQYGQVCLTTEDGSLGETGFVTQHSVLNRQRFDFIATCGPKPMMQAVARYAKERGIECEASLENLMACGLGACLCCVEKTTTGNRCVCKEGPVFNIKELLWQ